MMLSSMKLHKSQVSNILSYTTPGIKTASVYEIKKRIMAGYKEVVYLVISAAGGYAGNVVVGDRASYSSGPGGGSAAMYREPLSDFYLSDPESLEVVVGSSPPKADGRTTHGKALDGGSGGASSFRKAWAQGGSGSKGGTTSATASTIPSTPGSSNSSSANGHLGVVSGKRGLMTYMGTDESKAAARGGTGGTSLAKTGSTVNQSLTEGYAGSARTDALMPDVVCPAAPSQSPNYAGGGGGFNAQYFLKRSTKKYYGSSRPGGSYGDYVANGAVFIKFI